VRIEDRAGLKQGTVVTDVCVPSALKYGVWFEVSKWNTVRIFLLRDRGGAGSTGDRNGIVGTGDRHRTPLARAGRRVADPTL
jgi:hypothetical protein